MPASSTVEALKQEVTRSISKATKVEAALRKNTALEPTPANWPAAARNAYARSCACRRAFSGTGAKGS
jgi:hypothetical protein